MAEQWHERLVRLQAAKGWSNRETAMHYIALSPFHEETQLDSVIAMFKRYRRGEIANPSPETQQAIAAMFDLPVADFFAQRPLANQNVPSRLSPTEFTDLVAALRMPKVGEAHLAQAESEVERLCTAYSAQDARSLTTEVDDWLKELASLVHEGRVSIAGHERVIHLTGWLSLLRACLMWDQGDEQATHQARVAAEGFAADLGDNVMAAWTWEIRAWMALTQGDMPNVIAAADAGIRCAPNASVAAQLHAQKAKAYARMKDSHKTEVALDRVREVLDSNDLPSNVRNHFNVDPTKASFYAMDAYRTLHGRERMADAMADTVIATSTRPDGTVISPMRLAEAQLTKAVLAARDGSPQTALELAGAALNHERRSQPSLLLVASEVAHELEYRSPADGAEFRIHLRALSAPESPPS